MQAERILRIKVLYKSELDEPIESDHVKLQNHEREYILNVLKQVNGNKTEAAKILGIGRTTLWRKINNK